MNVLITGATGFIGKQLVKTLIDKGYYCRCLVRKTKNINELKDLTIDLAHGDISNPASLKDITQGIDIVYHLAAQMGKWGIPEEHFYAINVHGTKNLLEEASQSNVKQFIFCSTPGVQGKGNPQASETMPYNPPYLYEKSKCEAEKLVLEFYKNKNLPVTIIRPDFVYGPGDVRRLPLYKSIRDRKFYIIGSGQFLLHPTYIDDVIQGFLRVTDNPATFGEIYNIAGPHLVTVEEFVKTISHLLNVTLPRLKIPKVLAMTTARVLETFSKINGKEPFISRSKIEFLTNSHGSDISKAQSQIHYQPRYEFQDGMKQTIEWYYEKRLL
jgi:UDP-glucose 4-epimerase